MSRPCDACSRQPCAAGERCDEAQERCLSAVCEEVDAGGDGHASFDCGGGDCDDDDGTVFPGASEVCNLVNEDCSLETLGTGGDVDGDGYTSRACCNPSAAGMVCGDDCDDARADVHPGVTDACGNGDEDCDGAVDEDPTVMVYPDVDGDGFGVPEGATLACAASSGYALNADDCDDTRANVHPGAFEACNGRDDDCNAEDDDTELGCHCVDGEQQPCGATDVGDCELGIQTCLSGRWGACAGEVTIRTEACGAGDEDCDGSTDEDGAVGGTVYFIDEDEDGYGSTSGLSIACAPRPGLSSQGGDCDPINPLVNPSAESYFTVPACADADYQEACGQPTCWRCDPRPARFAIETDWDYDCNGTAEYAWPPHPDTALLCVLAEDCSDSSPRPVERSDGERYSWLDCGLRVRHRGCEEVDGNCVTVDEVRPLGCR